MSTRARNVAQRDSAKATSPNTLLRSRCKVKRTRMGLLWCDRQSGAAARSVRAHPAGAGWLVAPGVAAGGAAGSPSPAALRMACVSFFRASRVGSGMRLDDFLPSLAPAAAAAGSLSSALPGAAAPRPVSGAA